MATPIGQTSNELLTKASRTIDSGSNAIAVVNVETTSIFPLEIIVPNVDLSTDALNYSTSLPTTQNLLLNGVYFKFTAGVTETIVVSKVFSDASEVIIKTIPTEGSTDISYVPDGVGLRIYGELSQQLKITCTNTLTPTSILSVKIDGDY